MKELTLDATEAETLSQPGEIAVTVHDRIESISGLRDEWDLLVKQNGCPIYLTFDWVETWWKFYSNGNELVVYVCRSNGVLVGVVPIFLESVRLWPFTFRIARVVGAARPPREIRLPVVDQIARSLYEWILGDLFRSRRCDLWSLGLVAEDYATKSGLSESCKEHSELVEGAEFEPNDVGTTFRLPGTYDDYFKSLSKRERKNRRQRLRDLESNHSVRLEVVDSGEHLEDEFEEFARQHTIQWREDGRPGHFGAWTDALEFNREMVRKQSELRRARFVKLYADDVLIANQYTYAFGDAIFALLPARVTGDQWCRYGLGCTSQIKLIESSIKDGFQRLESGIGHYEYKVHLNGEEHRVGTVRILRSGRWASCKIAMFKAGGNLLRLVLHKLWYRRIAPRLRASATMARPSILISFDF